MQNLERGVKYKFTHPSNNWVGIVLFQEESLDRVHVRFERLISSHHPSTTGWFQSQLGKLVSLGGSPSLWSPEEIYLIEANE